MSRADEVQAELANGELTAERREKLLMELAFRQSESLDRMMNLLEQLAHRVGA
jgi:hypothetical protein